MLKALLISKVRVKMLRQFILEPDDSYHVRGLVRKLDEEINAVRRELQNLEDINLLSSKKKGNKLVYSLVKENPLINDLRSLLRIDQSDVQAFIEVINKFKDIDIALLTENYFTEKYKEDIDIDILIIGNVNAHELADKMKAVEERIERPLRMTVIKTSDLRFRQKKRDPFLLNILSKETVFLKGSYKEMFHEEEKDTKENE